MNRLPIDLPTPRPPPHERQPGPGLLARTARAVLRLGVGLIALCMLLSAVVLGTLLALGLVAWALLRGRKPQAAVFSSVGARYRQARSRPRRAEPAEVVDVPTRVVPESELK